MRSSIQLQKWHSLR